MQIFLNKLNSGVASGNFCIDFVVVLEVIYAAMELITEKEEKKYEFSDDSNLAFSDIQKDIRSYCG